jgi:FkbM family methyltransferase
MKQMIKQLLATLHLSITRNQKYDAYTRKIIAQTLRADSNCIDVGCHKGEILDLMVAGAPQGKKFAFEPIPELFQQLVAKYSSDNQIVISDVALYDRKGTTSFQHVLNAPAYSGIKKRRYDEKHVDIQQITVQTDQLDNLIPTGVPVHLIKIDVEGAEFHVMKGGVETIRRNKPVIIFEFGLGAADFYDSKPHELFTFLSIDCGMKVSTLRSYLAHDPSLTEGEFKRLFEEGREYYFVAHS